MPLPRQVDDITAEQLLAGRADSPELESVATVMQALREVSAQPVRPSDALRAQMAAGVFTDGPVYSYRPASRGLAWRVAAAVVTTIARMRLATKLAAAAVAAAVLGTSTVGVAGSLPEPVQDGFETVVESVTPYQFPGKTGDPDGGTDPADPATDQRDRTGDGETGEDTGRPGGSDGVPGQPEETGPPEEPGRPEDAGPPDGVGPPEDPGPPGGGGPPEDRGPPDGVDPPGGRP